MNPVIIAALVVGAATVGAVMLAVSAFRRPLPNLAGTLNAVFDTSDPLLTGPGLDGSTPAGRYVEFTYTEERDDGVPVLTPKALLSEVRDVR
jgi:hypothetical protein